MRLIRRDMMVILFFRLLIVWITLIFEFRVMEYIRAHTHTLAATLRAKVLTQYNNNLNNNTKTNRFHFYIMNEHMLRDQ